MAKVKFTATSEMQRYTGTYSCTDCQVREIPDAEAKRLIETFPKNFSLADGAVEETAPETTAEGEADGAEAPATISVETLTEFPRAVLDGLIGAEYTTIQSVIENADKLTQIKGIGEATAQKIVAACEAILDQEV